MAKKTKRVAVVKTVENKKLDIENKIEKILKDKFKEYGFYIDVVCYENNQQCIIHCNKYSSDRDEQLICFDIMFFLYEKLGSKKINSSNIMFNDGCGTCGHGAETKVTITIDEVDFTKIR